MKDGNKKNSNSKKLRIGKIVIKDVKRFSISVVTFIVCIVLLCILISNLADKSSGNNSNLSSTTVTKYDKELLAKYEKDSMKKQFLEDYNKIQNAVGLYIINNSTMDDNSINVLTNKLNDILKTENWLQELNIEYPADWKGKWSVDAEGILKFKFENKNIEPSWISSSEDILVNVIRN